jgi:hypothetical protein
MEGMGFEHEIIQFCKNIEVICCIVMIIVPICSIILYLQGNLSEITPIILSSEKSSLF